MPSSDLPLTLGESPALTTVCWPVVFDAVCMRGISIKQTYIFIHGECLFYPGCLCPTYRFKAAVSHMELRCGSSLSAWKVGGKEAFHGLSPPWIELYILLNSFASELDPAVLYCELPGVKQTRIIVFSIFSALLLPLLIARWFDYLCWSSESVFLSHFSLNDKNA